MLLSGVDVDVEGEEDGFGSRIRPVPVYNKDRKKLIGTGPASSLQTALTDSPSRRKRSRKPRVCMIPETSGKSLEGKTNMSKLSARAVSDPSPQDPKIGSFVNLDILWSKTLCLLAKIPTKRTEKDTKITFMGPDFDNLESNQS